MFKKRSSESSSLSSSLASTSFETVQHLPINLLESLENARNTQLQSEQELSFYMESDENQANEKLAAMNVDTLQRLNLQTQYEGVEGEEEREDDSQIYVPVRYARTEAGTYFWTTNLHQPTISNIYQRPQESLEEEEDSDVSYSEPYSDYDYPAVYGFGYGQDRWAQA